MSNKYIMDEILAVILIIAITAVITTVTGCSKSPDELYAESKELLLNEETFEKGVETLVLFEHKFPNDPRAPEIVLALATSYQSLKNFDEAAQTFQRLIEKYPDSSEAYKGMFLLGYMYYEDVNNEKKAKSILNRFIELYPDSELTVSAKVLVENIGLPVEEWSTVKKIGSDSRN